MKKLLWGIAFLYLIPFVPVAQEVQNFGKIDISDLTLSECDFEKDANALVLFDKGDIYFDQQFDIILERHKRIKIFNDKAKDLANIRIEFYSISHYEEVYDLKAQTINLKDGKAVITKIDKKQIFREVVDKNRTAFVFSLPDVQRGSVIEYEYKLKTPSYSNFPSWFFQSSVPTRYTELKTAIPDMLSYKPQYRIHQPIFKSKTSSESRSLGSGSEAQSYSIETKVIGLKNVPSLPDEPYMTSRHDNLQSVLFQLVMIHPIGGFAQTGTDTWTKVAAQLAEDEDFGLQFRKKLDEEDSIISKAKTLKSDYEKISYLFNYVRDAMKWDGSDKWYTNDGISKAWQKKTGNSTEINLILYRLLKQSEVKNTFPMIVSTRDNGKINIGFPWLYQFNKTIVYISVDSTTNYFLDASDKYGTFLTKPIDLLNSYGLALDRENKKHHLVSITNPKPATKNIFISAEIKPDGRMYGSANLVDYSYHKISCIKKFKTEGEDKYKQWLSDNDNNLKINSLAFKDQEVDTLPLNEQIGFELELTASDGEYIYFTPSLFSGFRKNPFLSENRTTLVDFGSNNKYMITGVFKIPDGYKIDDIPKSINMVMPDRSISFQRIAAQNENSLTVRFVLDFKKPYYTVEEYPMLREFYRQIFEMLNEQIVLKKS